MIAKYVASVAIVVLLVSLAATKLRFASRSQVRSGTTIEENWPMEFTLDADSRHMYRVSTAMQQALQEEITFPSAGPVHVDSATVQVTPKDVSWTENRTTITAPGAGLVAHVKWETPQDAANGAHGFIFIRFPELPGATLNFHSGGYQKDDQGRFVLREVTTYQSPIRLSFALLGFALVAGLPFGILLHFIWWAFQLKNEKRARLAALPSRRGQLPRTFYPNPIAEWTVWAVIFGIFALIGSLLAGFSAYDGFMSSSMAWFIYGALAAGLVVALISAYFTGRYVTTVTVDSNGISYARGRGEINWLTAQWGDILTLTEKSRTYRGTRREWLEIKFKDMSRKKLKLQQDIEGYPDLKSILFSVFAPPRPA